MPKGNIILICGQSSKLTSVTRKQAAADATKNRTNQKGFESCIWHSDGAAVTADADRLQLLLLHYDKAALAEEGQKGELREMQAPPPPH